MSVLTPELVDQYRQFDSASVSNAIETFDVRLRNEGFADGRIRCLFPDQPPVVGHAVTARIRSSAPPPVGLSYHDRTDWWNYIVSVPAPRIVVVQDVDDRPGPRRVRRRRPRPHPAGARLRRLRHQRIGPRSRRRPSLGFQMLRLRPRDLPRVRAHRRLRRTGGGGRPRPCRPATSCSATAAGCCRCRRRSSRRFRTPRLACTRRSTRHRVLSIGRSFRSTACVRS